jgi:hypothetical protein
LLILRTVNQQQLLLLTQAITGALEALLQASFALFKAC